MKKIILKLCVVVIISLVFVSCGPTIYRSSDAKDLASNHNSLAILPAKITIEARKNIAPQAIEEQQQKQGFVFQDAIYTWILRQKSNNRIYAEIQDIEKTNAILKKI